MLGGLAGQQQQDQYFGKKGLKFKENQLNPFSSYSAHQLTDRQTQLTLCPTPVQLEWIYFISPYNQHHHTTTHKTDE